MNLKQVTNVYFSPTGNTKTVVELIARRISDKVGAVDLTDAGKRPDYHFTEDEAVVVGVPVYGGRVPKTAAERLKKLHGRHTPAVLVITYGNRAYDDSLLELKSILVQQGFRPAAAVAAPAEHNIIRSIAAGRPDAEDRKRLRQIGGALKKMFGAMKSSYQIRRLQVPGKEPFREFQGVPLKIKVGSSCSNCKTCIRKCPVQAISRTDPKVTDTQRCIVCMRCVKECPSQARKINKLVLLAVGQRLKMACAERKKPELFLIGKRGGAS